MEYPIDRFAMEVKRQLDVLDRQLATSEYIAGDSYTIADIAIFPWYGGMVKGWQYGNSATFLSVHEYKNVQRWAEMMLGAACGEARAHSQPHQRRAVDAVARTPRGERLRDQDAGQGGGGGRNGAAAPSGLTEIVSPTVTRSCRDIKIASNLTA